MSNFKHQLSSMPVIQNIFRIPAFNTTAFISELYFLLTTSIFLFPLFSFVQTEKIDNLKKVLLTTKYTQRVNCLDTLSKIFLDVQPHSGLLYVTGFAYSKKIKHG